MLTTKFFAHAVSVFMWAACYFLLGVVSIEFEHPISQLALVWFPAGVAVSAFLCSQRTRWPFLFAVFLIVHILLDPERHNNSLYSVVDAILSTCGAILIAWLVRRFARSNDYLHSIIIWIVATLCIYAMQGALIVAWLILTESRSFDNIFWLIWIEEVTGVIFATIVIMSFLSSDRNTHRPTPKVRLIGLISLFLLFLSTWFIFGADLRWLTNRIAHNIGAAMNFVLAFVPIIFAVIVSVIWNRRGTSFALVIIAALVIHYTDNGQGPFYLKDLRAGEPLILAQCYLCATALLMVFLRTLTNADQGYDLHTGREAGAGVMYRLNLVTGTILWDDNLLAVLGVAPPALLNIEDVLERVHSEDREKLRRHWATKNLGTNGASLIFRINLGKHNTQTICDHTPGILTGSDGEIIVGNWQISHYR